MDSSNTIEERASQWLARRDGEDWSSADEGEFQAWLAASTHNRVAFLRLDAVWQQANRLRAVGAGIPSGIVPPPGEWRQSPFFGPTPVGGHAAGAEGGDLQPKSLANDKGWRSFNARSRFPVPALAASVLLAVAIALTVYLWPSGPAYVTPIGGVAAVPMPDGSKITLNTNSEVRVTVTARVRHVELQKGEAFFEVAHDPRRPFVVESGPQRFVAVGTRFSVRRYGQSNRLVVTEGRVRIESADVAFARDPAPATEVAAGGIAQGTPQGVLVATKLPADAEIMLSWRSGYLVFKDTALADAVAEFNRYNTTQIVIDDTTVGEIRIGGNFRSTNADAFVRLLEDGFPVRVERQGGILHLMSE